MNRAGGQREMVFCHECENEWYRDEHGLSCPECHSDFCEVIESDHDPRNDYIADEEPPALNFHNHPNFHVAPDPDEDDIDHVRFMPHPSGDGFTMHGVSHDGRQNPVRENPVRHPVWGHSSAPPQDPRQAVFQNFTNMLGGFMGGPGAGGQAPQIQTHTRTVSFGFSNGRTYYSSTTNGVPSGGPQARDAPNPQMGQQPMDDIHNMLGQMLAGMESPRTTVHNPPQQPANPIASLFNMFFNPSAAAHGDAVYTQEALDRVISQLMEQNSAGNAPGPASQEEIASLPKKKVDKSMLGDQGNTDCSICMDAVELGTEVTVLYCGHWFHEDCIGMWLNSHDTCPHCRMGIREAREKKQAAESAGPGPGAGSSGAEPESPSRMRGIRRASTLSMRRRSSAGSSANNNGGSSAGGGILDRARNFLSRSGSSS